MWGASGVPLILNFDIEKRLVVYKALYSKE